MVDSVEDSEKTHSGELQPAQPNGRWQAIALVATCTLSMILNTSSATAASIALPTIGRDLHIKEEKLQWIISAFSLSSGCLLLFFGRIADLYGRKIVFLGGIAFLGIFSLGAGFARDEIAIDVLRGVQGIGGAAVIPASLGILAHAFPPSNARSIAFATFAAGAPIGAAVGNLIGGTLTQLTRPTWRSGFFLIAGLSLATFMGGAFFIDRDKPSEEEDRRVDWLGAFLVTVGLVLIVFVLSEGSIAPHGWKTPYIIACIVVGFILLLLFVAWQFYLEHLQRESRLTNSRWTPPPLMKVSIWTRSRGRMAVILWIAFLEWSSFLSWAFWVQLYYQNYQELTPVLTMIRLLPMSVTGCICNVVVALVVGRVRVVFLIVCGTVFTATANLLFAVIKTSSPYWAFGFPATIVSVFGADFVFAAGTLFVAKISLPHEQSLSGALFQTMTQLGASFGLAITTIIFNSETTRQFNRANPPQPGGLVGPPKPFDQLSAYRAVMWGGFAFAMFGALLAAVFLRSVGIVGHQQVPDGEDQNNKAEETTAHGENEEEKKI
ncbi:MFS general substrate transporter [Trametopsis cervina]|nr:MFS general substrate transporter [Trametopsis cervina]